MHQLHTQFNSKHAIKNKNLKKIGVGPKYLTTNLVKIHNYLTIRYKEEHLPQNVSQNSSSFQHQLELNPIYDLI